MRTYLEEERLLRSLEWSKRPNFPHGDYVGLADSLAEEIGVLPMWDALRTEDAVLHDALWNGPLIPAHYGLLGPGECKEFASNLIHQVNYFS